VTAFEELPANVKARAMARLIRIRDRAKGIGWGYGDFVSDVVAALERRGKPRPRPATAPVILRTGLTLAAAGSKMEA
jgi:hypothetical protein